jgi:hypothetical protein
VLRFILQLESVLDPIVLCTYERGFVLCFAMHVRIHMHDALRPVAMSYMARRCEGRRVLLPSHVFKTSLFGEVGGGPRTSAAVTMTYVQSLGI